MFPIVFNKAFTIYIFQKWFLKKMVVTYSKTRKYLIMVSLEYANIMENLVVFQPNFVQFLTSTKKTKYSIIIQRNNPSCMEGADLINCQSFNFTWTDKTVVT